MVYDRLHTVRYDRNTACTKRVRYSLKQPFTTVLIWPWPVNKDFFTRNEAWYHKKGSSIKSSTSLSQRTTSTATEQLSGPYDDEDEDDEL